MNFNGLKSSEVEVSRTTYGSNKLPEPELKKWYHFAKEALTEPITMILIIIALFQLVLGAMGVMSLSEPVMIIVVLAIVTEIAVKTGLGIQKSAAELRAKTAVRYCDVVRDGSVQTINKDDLVVGDLVLLRTGQEIFADGFIVDGEISVNNAAINGETKECRKIPSANYKHVKTTSTTAYTDQCSLFAGTVIMSGEGKMIVTDVGVNTVNGDTLVKMQTLEPPKTALDIALDHLCDFISKWGTIAAVLAFVIMTITGILNAGSLSQYFSGNILENIQKVAQNISNALTIIVAAVPEGLPLIVKLVTKQNVSTMEKFNILAKNTGKIPELAYVNLICTDKTGTLTTGEMTSTVMVNGNCQDIFNKESSLNELIDLNICMNNSAVFDSNGNITGGNSIDRAVLDMLSPEDAQKIQNKAIMKKRVPFSSENKFSAVTLNNGANDFTVYKGAPEKLIEKCKFYLDNDGIATELTEEKRKALKSHIKGLTEKAMRCIALTISDKTDDGLPDEMNLLGVIGVVDPVRNEVPEAVKIAHKAGIQVIEITGDCMETAKAVAMEAGIYKPGDLAVTNDEFEAMSDVKVKEIIPQLRVISRCSPNTKLRLVTLAQEIGMSVAMTGDGVNDAPALKKADVGFGMQDGSDVAKEAADIVLTDNNFASVVKAVELGRTFMHNIMMFLEFQLPINISLLILSMVFPIISGGSALLAAVQILIVNIIMDSLNSLSFGGEPPKEEYMNEEPIMKGSGLFIRGAKGRIALSSIVFIALFGVITFGPVGNMFATKLSAMTARFALLCLMAVFNGFTIRTDSMNLFKGIKNNKLFVYIALGIFAMAVVLCNFVGNLVQTTPMDVKQWIVVLVTAFMVVPVDWIRKAICKKGSN
ncbi:calcium-translocating P-type ATPase, PMCA-type [Blautia obeum]|jgi:calcium-translocating P-type ATPase|uniref:P-type Ca(2+) transporter n=1 Tax=Blautia obeum TaxID=40520 RepID=A0A173ZZV1_9FIRM|nr:calcium-translocating P-type ATPase, PMCA-type [Blautia obeum]CUN81159.1 Calcium-transporting ATPase lmo0841 [Blautia obeum]